MRAACGFVRLSVRTAPQSCARRWQVGRAPSMRGVHRFNEFGGCGEFCRAPHHSTVQRNKPPWDAEDFTSTILSYSRVCEFSLPARLADGKKKCVDVPRCDTASRALWRRQQGSVDRQGVKKGKTPIPKCLGVRRCRSLPLASVARTLKWRKRNAQKRIRI